MTSTAVPALRHRPGTGTPASPPRRRGLALAVLAALLLHAWLLGDATLGRRPRVEAAGASMQVRQIAASPAGPADVSVATPGAAEAALDGSPAPPIRGVALDGSPVPPIGEAALGVAPTTESAEASADGPREPGVTRGVAANEAERRPARRDATRARAAPARRGTDAASSAGPGPGPGLWPMPPPSLTPKPVPSLAASSLPSPPPSGSPALSLAPSPSPSSPEIALDEPPAAGRASSPAPTRPRVPAEPPEPAALRRVVDAEPEAAASGRSGAARDADAASPARAAVDPLDGEPPPPVYRTALPPAGRWLYEVRRGFLRGDGEIRWRPDGDAYTLGLQAGIAGTTLLEQTSEGRIGAAGLEPRRFVDRRARRSAQAANFDADARRITFSGRGSVLPLLAGTQDRLGILVQLAGIVAADPALQREGARVSVVVTSARGEAALWQLRGEGLEETAVADGVVRALKFSRRARSVSDTAAEVWLDPARGFLPVRATFGNAGGAVEVELRLQRVEAD